MNTGFSLVESLVIISIISILASLSLVALPAARAHQQLISDTELVTSLLLDSKQRAINQVRPEECQQGPDLESTDRAACSDVGIVFKEGKVIQFANIAGGSEDDPDYNYDGDSQEYIIVEHQLSTSVVEEESDEEMLFRSTPPSVEAYKNGVIMGPQDITTITLATKEETRILTISQFGTVDINEE